MLLPPTRLLVFAFTKLGFAFTLLLFAFASIRVLEHVSLQHAGACSRGSAELYVLLFNFTKLARIVFFVPLIPASLLKLERFRLSFNVALLGFLHLSLAFI
jgi:hypothetical protein